jgi:RNA recognition motif-containing protein
MIGDGESQQEKSEVKNDHIESGSSLTCNTTTLFVGSLHPRIGDLHLQKLFSPYGSINRIHIVTHKPGVPPSQGNPMSKTKASTKHSFGSQHSKGYAFVEYSTIESARMAMSRLDGRSLLGKNLVVRPATRQKMDRSDGTEEATAEEAKKEVKSLQSKIDSVRKALEKKGISENV